MKAILFLALTITSFSSFAFDQYSCSNDIMVMVGEYEEGQPLKVEVISEKPDVTVYSVEEATEQGVSIVIKGQVISALACPGSCPAVSYIMTLNQMTPSQSQLFTASYDVLNGKMFTSVNELNCEKEFVPID